MTEVQISPFPKLMTLAEIAEIWSQKDPEDTAGLPNINYCCPLANVHNEHSPGFHWFFEEDIAAAKRDKHNQWDTDACNYYDLDPGIIGVPQEHKAYGDFVVKVDQLGKAAITYKDALEILQEVAKENKIDLTPPAQAQEEQK